MHIKQWLVVLYLLKEQLKKQYINYSLAMDNRSKYVSAVNVLYTRESSIMYHFFIYRDSSLSKKIVGAEWTFCIICSMPLPNNRG